MAKIIDIKSKKLQMERNGYIYKLEFFRKDSMEVYTSVYDGAKFLKKEIIPFAQLTKKLKQFLN